ncbi:MAG: hypothetical protein WCW47_01295 [Candidatus Paceibacterota bacterium]|jgi:ABC-type multidrug transport system permease subunit
MTEIPESFSKRNTDLSERFKEIRASLVHQQGIKRPLQYNIRPFGERSIQEKIALEKGQLENRAFEQDIGLKKNTLFILFWFLAAETVAIFVIAFFQGFKTGGFEIEGWSFRLLITATITQITVMLLIAVKHLFPNKPVM